MDARHDASPARETGKGCIPGVAERLSSVGIVVFSLIQILKPNSFETDYRMK